MKEKTITFEEYKRRLKEHSMKELGFKESDMERFFKEYAEDVKEWYEENPDNMQEYFVNLMV